ncbi:aminoglycoside phosphotransferase family protein [Streptomyces sp. DSM 44917]|uniref:Aminoglycoside phosphotransferase family protein n=1 Tax=Streptomyces boetiae TaxID=3075541 RepID=A0ABU2LDU8_9ACTN|nr:aminoglycoside phosphotransferase family protein [Streptomyces sp. DSM 44917]MDT0309759.1 aminoglycoside phosphotransferase family protein [Streptomyces sp. DSM 44917]
MTAPASLPGGFEQTEMYRLLDLACAEAGLDSAGAEVLRGQTNAVIRLERAPVVVKIARRGTPVASVARTVAFVRWLTGLGFPTVLLHPGIDQPAVIEGHPVTYWTYLPQPPQPVQPVRAVQLAGPLRALHGLPAPPFPLRPLDNIAAIRASLAAITALPEEALRFLADRADALEKALTTAEFAFPETVLQGDPQHRNALHDAGAVVLCDWDTVAWGRPEWDLTTIEIHCRRFGHGQAHYRAFANAYGFDVRDLPAYPVLRDIRELRMITTNARKTAHTPGTLAEVRRRITGLRLEQDDQPWNIL